MILNDYILDQLMSYYPDSKKAKPAIADEIAAEFGQMGLGEREFDDILRAYRKANQWCPELRTLQPFMPVRKSNWKGRMIHGIFVQNKSDALDFFDLTQAGCGSPSIFRKYGLKNPGDQYVRAAEVLGRCATTLEEQARATKYMQGAIKQAAAITARKAGE